MARASAGASRPPNRNQGADAPVRAPRQRAAPGRRWNLVCRVVDNFGDAGVVWRLARQLAREHGLCVRLFIDRRDVLARLAPATADNGMVDGVVDGVTVCPLADDARVGRGADVVVAAFHARLPPAARRAVASSGALLIQLEYLTAERWIDSWHGLPSRGADGVVEHYFYPGFSAASGGLIREADLLARRERHRADPSAGPRFLAALGIRPPPCTVVASLFCYPHAPLDTLAAQLAGTDHRLWLVAPGRPADPGAWDSDTDALARRSGGRLQLIRVPFLSQDDYDTLLWSCDLNFVRGEDSWIRAIWAGQPFVWQPYPQADDAHRVKLDAFLAQLGPDDAALRLGRAMRWWSSPSPGHSTGRAPGSSPGDTLAADEAPLPALLDRLDEARRVVQRLADWLSGQADGAAATRPDGLEAADLARRLVAFATERIRRAAGEEEPKPL